MEFNEYNNLGHSGTMTIRCDHVMKILVFEYQLNGQYWWGKEEVDSKNHGTEAISE